MDTLALYNTWLNEVSDCELSEDLNSIKDDENEIYERFYKDLSFGTAGLRGILGAGTNRMNIYTVRAATQGFCAYLLKREKNPCVAIAYDSRIKSTLFSKETASVFMENGIRVYIYPAIMPTPMLSFAIRELKCQAGVNITASHNPKEYNGYKAYLSDGCQIDEVTADEIYKEIKKLNPFKDIKSGDFEEGIKSGMIKYISDDISKKYYELTVNSIIDKNAFINSDAKVIYTPLCGAGNIPVKTVMSMAGLKNIKVVKEQEEPDGTFSSCPYPNPEFIEALNLGIEYAQKENADILIATDPDSDRLGAVIFKDNVPLQLTGNQVGILMTYYILEAMKLNNSLPENPTVIKSIVSTPLIEKIVSAYGGTVYETLTGFKNICGKMAEMEEKNSLNNFVFAFEESCGYLPFPFVRDKDGVTSALLMAEMTCHYKKEGKTLTDVLAEIYSKFGYYIEETISYAFKGHKEALKLKNLIENLFITPPTDINGIEVVSYDDYKNSVTVENGVKIKRQLPKSDVLIVNLIDGTKVAIRPSGTEPKLKAYVMVRGDNYQHAHNICQTVKKGVDSIILL